MNPYRAKTTAWNEWSAQPGRSPAVWSSVTDFFRRQPEFVLGAALVGGALLAYWIKNTGNPTAQAPNTARYEPTPSWSGQSMGQRGRQQDQRHSWPRQEEPRRMPSARLGATEDQMKNLATPSPRALEAGDTGATGAAYDLDPNSITGG